MQQPAVDPGRLGSAAKASPDATGRRTSGGERRTSSDAIPEAVACTTEFRPNFDRFKTISEVQDGLRQAGLESSNLIIATDHTRSNESSGKHSFAGRCLHSITGPPNPYEQAIQTIGRTLEVFDDDRLIPCFGFGDASTEDRAVFSYFEDERPARGFEEVLSRYRELVPHVKMQGPTSFAPAIQQAMKIVAQNNNDYHILLIIADGQVTRCSDTPDDELSIQEIVTIDAIVEASHMPLSIVMVGVGDGPWEMMEQFDKRLPERRFDNFRFVNFTELCHEGRHLPQYEREAMFALRALMEIPDQYKFIAQAGMLGGGNSNLGYLPQALPPPSVATSSQRRAPAEGGKLFTAFADDLIPATPCAVARTPDLASLRLGGGAQCGSDAGEAQEEEYLSTIARLPTNQNPAPGPLDTNDSLNSGPFSTNDSLDSRWPLCIRDSLRPAPPRQAEPGVQAFERQRDSSCSSSAASQLVTAVELPNMFMCPISHEVMSDPVHAADGYTYERKCIESWLQRSNTSPMTGAPLGNSTLYSNCTLRSAIMEALQARTGHPS